MKTYVIIDNVAQRFNTIQDAVQYAEDNFDDEIESFEMSVYSENGENLDCQTVERNPYSNQFVYAAWGFCVNKYIHNDDDYGEDYSFAQAAADWDYQGDEFDTLEQLLENADYLSAKAKGYGLRVEKYTQTIDENIGDVIDRYTEGRRE
jgi:hypothetical protein